MESQSPPGAAPTDRMQHAEPATEAWLGAQRLGVGVLCIAEARLTWTEAVTGRQLALAYPAIHVHAIARGGSDADAFTRPHLLLMAECGGGDPPSLEEVRFCPEAADSLPAMFEAMSRCQALNSDGGEVGAGGGGGFGFAADEATNDDDNDIDGENFHGDDCEEEGGDDDDGPDFDHLLVGGPEDAGLGTATATLAGAGDRDNQPMETEQFEDAP